MRRPDKRKLVWVKWHDAVGDSSRVHVDDLAGLSLATNENLGWIIHEDEKRIVLAHGFSTTEEVDHFTIPKGDILAIEPAAHTPRSKKVEVK